VIGLPRGLTVYAFDEPCDMRKSFDTLTALKTRGPLSPQRQARALVLERPASV
jgi:hypothetical protein